MNSQPAIDKITVGAFTVPTETPESDGTLQWDKTTMVLVETSAGDQTGLGYSYADLSTAKLIESLLADLIKGRNAFDIPGTHAAMLHQIRNLGRPGMASMAISAVDNALWDLKAKLLGVPLVSLLGATREALPIYGSGGFTNYSIAKLQKQLGGWVHSGIARVKMKIGLDAKADRERVAGAREAIGPDADLFVDANGAYSRKQALAQAEAFAELNVTWFEEPVTSDDLEGLRLLRDRTPAGIDITAGEYGYDLTYFERMLSAGAVDVLQADATRCCGITGFLQAAALCAAHHVPLSSHCAPALHVHPGCAVGPMRHAEYFYDHVRIENMLFEGTPQPRDGALTPDLSRAGNGLELKLADAERYRIHL